VMKNACLAPLNGKEAIGAATPMLNPMVPVSDSASKSAGPGMLVK
jgi:hypothetical protein